MFLMKGMSAEKVQKKYLKKDEQIIWNKVTDYVKIHWNDSIITVFLGLASFFGGNVPIITEGVNIETLLGAIVFSLFAIVVILSTYDVTGSYFITNKRVLIFSEKGCRKIEYREIYTAYVSKEEKTGREYITLYINHKDIKGKNNKYFLWDIEDGIKVVDIIKKQKELCGSQEKTG